MLPFGNPVFAEFDGANVEFPKIFIEDYATLFMLRRKYEKEKVESAVKEGLIDKDQAKQMLLAIAASPENIFDIQNSTGDPRMQRAILEKSWQKSARAPADFERFIKSEDPAFLAELAFRVTKREKEPEATDSTGKPGDAV